jgi:hypothetical protein
MEFQLQVMPRLKQLSAEAMVQPEAEAKEVLKMAPRSPEQVRAVSEKTEALRSTADAIIQFTTRESSGSALFDKERERIRAFAVAREHSLDLLLKMLASPGLPKSDAWETWRTSCRDANQLWSGLRLK